jgi:hypothetical protein
MLIFLVIQVYLLLCGFFLAKKDAESYLMKDNISTPTVLKIIKRWHTDGVVLAVLVNVPLLYNFSHLWWEIAVVNILLRLAEFDLVFNSYANLSTTFLGSTALTDKIFSKIFGVNGAIDKSITFFSLLILFNIAKVIFHF